MIYLVVYVVGILAAGILTGIYGKEIGIWISYCFLAAYGIMILANATLIEKMSEFNVIAEEDKETGEPLPENLGEEKIGEAVIREEPQKPSEEDIKRLEKITAYIKTNLDKGHKIEKIREPLDKTYGKDSIDWVLENAFKEPELPDLGKPEEEIPDLGQPEEEIPNPVKKKKKARRPKKKIITPGVDNA